ncbi:YIP1 family protein [Mangrovicoccus sp. HB161399]|uniref:YIP1 family protein n=1 Tax=Mangrovicoccus sp. HB161399 TaxID=2720392 RepID=UPI001C130B5F|nr:YIP1 family protein [Mangrovicoccus sp. HB161399]
MSSVAADILASYRRPGHVVRRRLALPEHEGRALAYLMLGCALVFVAQLPRLSREAALAEANDLVERASGELLVWMFFAPLAFYVLAAAANGLSKLFGGGASWYAARLATFWAFLAASPMWLCRGLVSAANGPGAALDLVTTVALLGWAAIWVLAMRAAARPGPGIAGSGGLA